MLVYGRVNFPATLPTLASYGAAKLWSCKSIPSVSSLVEGTTALNDSEETSRLIADAVCIVL